MQAYRLLTSSELNHHAAKVAPWLLGKLLLRRSSAGWMGGYICEAEAYEGEDDLGCHAKAGLTKRTAVMFGPPGYAYIYFTYGMHWMLNAVVGEQGHPAAVLIRSIYPIIGLDIMEVNRQHTSGWSLEHSARGWTDGPAKLSQALALDGRLNGTPLIDSEGEILILDADVHLQQDAIHQSARIGLFTVPEPWKSIQWNWKVTGKVKFPPLNLDKIPF